MDLRFLPRRNHGLFVWMGSDVQVLTGQNTLAYALSLIQADPTLALVLVVPTLT